MSGFAASGHVDAVARDEAADRRRGGENRPPQRRRRRASELKIQQLRLGSEVLQAGRQERSAGLMGGAFSIGPVSSGCAGLERQRAVQAAAALSMKRSAAPTPLRCSVTQPPPELRRRLRSLRFNTRGNADKRANTALNLPALCSSAPLRGRRAAVVTTALYWNRRWHPRLRRPAGGSSAAGTPRKFRSHEERSAGGGTLVALASSSDSSPVFERRGAAGKQRFWRQRPALWSRHRREAGAAGRLV